MRKKRFWWVAGRIELPKSFPDAPDKVRQAIIESLRAQSACEIVQSSGEIHFKSRIFRWLNPVGGWNVLGPIDSGRVWIMSSCSDRMELHYEISFLQMLTITTSSLLLFVFILIPKFSVHHSFTVPSWPIALLVVFLIWASIGLAIVRFSRLLRIAAQHALNIPKRYVQKTDAPYDY